MEPDQIMMKKVTKEQEEILMSRHLAGREMKVKELHPSLNIGVLAIIHFLSLLLETSLWTGRGLPGETQVEHPCKVKTSWKNILQLNYSRPPNAPEVY